ncbi:MAG: hypothetical protein RRZ70_06060 [Synergistaceae bacterium]
MIEIIGALLLFFLMLTAWAFKYDIFTTSLSIDKSLICIELDENRKPLKITENIPRGTRQVCLWFKYNTSRTPLNIKITWSLDNEVLLSEMQKLVTPEGVKAFYLLREDGMPLEDGRYSVTIKDGSKIISSIPFKIIKTEN